MGDDYEIKKQRRLEELAHTLLNIAHKKENNELQYIYHASIYYSIPVLMHLACWAYASYYDASFAILLKRTNDIKTSLPSEFGNVLVVFIFVAIFSTLAVLTNFIGYITKEGIEACYKYFSTNKLLRIFAFPFFIINYGIKNSELSFGLTLATLVGNYFLTWMLIESAIDTPNLYPDSLPLFYISFAIALVLFLYDFCFCFAPALGQIYGLNALKFKTEKEIVELQSETKLDFTNIKEIWEHKRKIKNKIENG